MSAQAAEMPRQVDSPMGYDPQDAMFGMELEMALQNAYHDDEMSGEDDQNPASSPLDLQVESDDFGDLFGEDEQQTCAQQPRDTAEQPEIQPAKPKAQTGLALPQNALPKEKPAVVKQPQATAVGPTVGVLGQMARMGEKSKGKQPVVYTGMQTPVSAAEQYGSMLPLDANIGGMVRGWEKSMVDNQLAYAGAQVPAQPAEHDGVLPATDLDMDEIDFGQIDEILDDEFHRAIAVMLGTDDQQPAAAPMAGMGAENNFVGTIDPSFDFDQANARDQARYQHAPVPLADTGAEDLHGGPVDVMFDPFATYHDGLAEQQQALAPVDQQGAGIAQAQPAAPVVNLPAQPVKDDIDLAFERGDWGRWNPKGMCGSAYVEHRRQPYDLNNPRDVHDYMQAVVVSLVRRPFQGDKAHTTPAALMWFDQAWKTVCQGLHEQRHKFNLLEIASQNCVRAFWFWVQRGSLLNEHGIELGNPVAERDIGGAMMTLACYQEMAETMQQDADAPQYLGEVIDLTRS